MSVVVNMHDVLQRRTFTTTGCNKLRKGYYPMISVGSSALALSPEAKRLKFPWGALQPWDCAIPYIARSKYITEDMFGERHGSGVII